MFRGISKAATHRLTRRERRLLTVADVTKNKRSLSQRYTYNEAVRQLARFDLVRRHHQHDSGTGFQHQHLVSMATPSDTSMPKPCLKFQENTRTQGPVFSYSRHNHHKQRHSNFSSHISRTNMSTTLRQNYDDPDELIGDSHIQLKFDELVHTALLRYGPPLPAEFVSANDVVTVSSTSPISAQRHGDMFTMGIGGSNERFTCSMDLGADSANYVMYDEVGLKPHELMRIIRLHQPSFSIQEDCDGVPFSLLVKNCSYFRAYGGKIHYMRYLRRKHTKSSAGSDNTAGGNDDNSLLVSIAKYKMREVPSQDGVRQGPRPWLYSYKLK
ncbi:unnamed protein product [Phytomonas sp. EM1]|nr:unnamed protein product [Phytomonas sp. EM1]|eukprot:CCW61472.1 unnamed protein product [Phytomonas sp. isolate EM1]